MTCRLVSLATCNPGPLGPSLVDVCPGQALFAFMSILNSMIRGNDNISGICERVKPVKVVDDEYDFVVVGGGAAGCVVAARLSEIPDWNVLFLEAGNHEPAGAEIPGFATTFLSGAAGSVVAARLSEILHWKVLLLEAGPDESAGTGIPGFAAEFSSTNIIWNYTTTNESNACLSTNGSCAWPSGKNLGGNTAHNGMIYLRGNPTDYDNWADLGNEGWTWEEVEPFYIKGEENGEIDRVGRKHHGTGGLLSVERLPYVSSFGYSFLDAADELGYGVSEDLNGETLTGLSSVQCTNKNGVRQSSATAYLRPARNRTNLHVSLNSTVTRVIIKNDTAFGVEYYKDGELKTVYATREIIVSGGVVESPKLLLLSGIGPKEHLESVGIRAVKDLPGVGANLHDHPGTQITYTINDIDTYDNNWDVAGEYLDFQTGPLSGTGSGSVIGLLASTRTASDYPDIELYLGGYRPNCAPGEVGALRSTGNGTARLAVSYLHPKSRGRITLASKDPFELPIIWANYLGEPEDVDRLIEGIRIALALLDTEALGRYYFTQADPFLAACTGYEYDTDEFWACGVRQFNYALYHQGGTCKMGPSSDSMAVVDPRLRVYGIKGLRVADTSIMPKIPSSNTAAPAMMIGERAADFIKEDWGRKFCQETRSHGI